MDEKDIRNDLNRFAELPPPVKRAAYSDRTAWMMAILSEIAYVHFDEEDRSSLLALAVEFAGLTDQDSIAEKLRSFASTLDRRDNTDNDILKSILRVGGFELKGVLFDHGTDTQGFVAVRRSSDGTGMAVISFRGTKQIQDWKTNLRIDKVPIKSARSNNKKTLGNIHRGFNDAFKSVEDQIQKYIQDIDNLPLYITGHSLGGALATVATWYIAGDKLAACYTFGAPRVGDDGLLDRFRTPIYRIVNGADPVPFIPPAGVFIDFLKIIFRTIGAVISVGGLVDWLTDFLIKYQKFRHYGYQRYLSICPEGEDGTYPDLKNEIGIGSMTRLWRYLRRLLSGEASARKRIDKYHDISIYRAKLREYAIRRHQLD